ncbi:uncharacterized protein [Aristolochia californica]|uniref:uncharacterized protein n=1 Tax=Aristolochia californica TaxID=171875 RepID=UPI0035E196B4
MGKIDSGGVAKRKQEDDLSSPAVKNGADQPFDLSLLEAVEKSQGNVEARLKYPDQLDKFTDSELKLQKLKILAGAPDLYPELVNLDTVKKLVRLLNHDNYDIAIDVVSLLQDLTDENVLEDNLEPAQVLVNALIENNAL